MYQTLLTPMDFPLQDTSNAFDPNASGADPNPFVSGFNDYVNWQGQNAPSSKLDPHYLGHTWESYHVINYPPPFNETQILSSEQGTHPPQSSYSQPELETFRIPVLSSPVSSEIPGEASVIFVTGVGCDDQSRAPALRNDEGSERPLTRLCNIRLPSDKSASSEKIEVIHRKRLEMGTDTVQVWRSEAEALWSETSSKSERIQQIITNRPKTDMEFMCGNAITEASKAFEATMEDATLKSAPKSGIEVFTGLSRPGGGRGATYSLVLGWRVFGEDGKVLAKSQLKTKLPVRHRTGSSNARRAARRKKENPNMGELRVMKSHGVHSSMTRNL